MIYKLPRPLFLQRKIPTAKFSPNQVILMIILQHKKNNKIHKNKFAVNNTTFFGSFSSLELTMY